LECPCTHHFVRFFFCKLKKALQSAGQPYHSDSHTTQNSTLSSKFNISTIAKKKRRVDENKIQEALKDYLDNTDKSIAQTAKEYGVNPRTMRDRINGLPTKTGKKPTTALFLKFKNRY
jgi:hypothetical protein